MSPRDYALLFSLGSLWGASFLFIKVALFDLSPWTVVFARVALGSAGLAVFAAITRVADATPATLLRNWRGALVLGVFSGVFPYLLITGSELFIPSGSAAILNATSPLFSALLALVVARGQSEERLTPGRLAGLLVGFAGVALLLVRPAAAPDNPTASTLDLLAGSLAVMAASLCYAIAALYTRRHQMDVAPAALSLGQNLTAAVIMLPLMLAFGGPFVMPGGAAIAAILALGLLNTSLAYLIYYALVKSAGATRALSVTYLQPATALVYGALLLAEPVTLVQIGGLAAILGGVALATRH